VILGVHHDIWLNAIGAGLETGSILLLILDWAAQVPRRQQAVRRWLERLASFLDFDRFDDRSPFVLLTVFLGFGANVSLVLAGFALAGPVGAATVFAIGYGSAIVPLLVALVLSGSFRDDPGASDLEELVHWLETGQAAPAPAEAARPGEVAGASVGLLFLWPVGLPLLFTEFLISLLEWMAQDLRRAVSVFSLVFGAGVALQFAAVVTPWD